MQLDRRPCNRDNLWILRFRFILNKVLLYHTSEYSTFCARSLASLEVISQVLFTSEQPKKNKLAFVCTLSQVKLLFKPLVIQLVRYILKQLFTSVSLDNCYYSWENIHSSLGLDIRQSRLLQGQALSGITYIVLLIHSHEHQNRTNHIRTNCCLH